MAIEDSYIEASRLAGGSDAGEFEPQRKNNFLLNLSPPTGVTGDTRVIMFSLQSFPFPKENTDAVVIDYINSQRKVPGKTTYPEVALVVRDYVDRETARILNRWKRLVFDPVTGKQGRARVVKGAATLTLFAPDGTYQREWLLVGVWPGNVDFGDGDMSSADPNMVTITLHLDYYKPLNDLAASSPAA